MLQAKLKICTQEKAGERQVSAEEARTNSATKRGEEVQSSEQDPPVQIFQLLGWRSVGRVKGSWGGLGGVWRGVGGILVRLEAGLKGGPGKGRKDGVTGRWGG